MQLDLQAEVKFHLRGFPVECGRGWASSLVLDRDHHLILHKQIKGLYTQRPIAQKNNNVSHKARLLAEWIILYEMYMRFLLVFCMFLYVFHTSTYTTICIWEISKRRSSNLLTFTRSATHVLRCVSSRLTMNHCWALFPEPVRCTGALGAGAAEARALTEKMPCSKRLRKKQVKNMGVSKNSGTPKWMVYNGKPYQNGWLWKCYYNGRHDWRVKCQHVNMTEDGSVVQPSGPKKLKHYTESQSTCLVVN